MKVKNETEVAQSCPALRDPMDHGAGIDNFLTEGKKAPFLIGKVLGQQWSWLTFHGKIFGWN